MMQYDKTFKEEALCLSDEIGLKNAATQLGVSYYTLSGCVTKEPNMDRMLFLEVGTPMPQEILRNNTFVILKKRMRSSNDRMKFCRRRSGFSLYAERSKNSRSFYVYP